MQVKERLNKAVKSKVAALIAVAAAGAAATAPAHAAIDVAGVVTEINGTLTPIGTIGAAVLLVVVGIAAFKWVRRAIH